MDENNHFQNEENKNIITEEEWELWEEDETTAGKRNHPAV